MDDIKSLQISDSDPSIASPKSKGRIGKAKAKKPVTKAKSDSAQTLTVNDDQAPQSSKTEIVAYSQQSRFYRETFDANSTDLDIKGVNLSVGGLDLLVDAHLRLKTGVRYGMVGQNGVGKSVLMSVLGDDILVGLPQNVRFLHIAQLEEFISGRTILEEVLGADTERARIIREAEALQAISPSKSSSESDLNKAIHSILLDRSQEAVSRAQKVATKRSGQRGHTARQDLLAAEAAHRELASQDPQTYITSKLANEVMKEAFGAYETLDVEGDVARAKTVLRGLGFREADLEKEGRHISDLSGGWRMRVMLGKALFMRPDILLLDEPTNHLDLPAILWLQHHLINEIPEQTVVIVSHDRNFLDAVTTETIIFREKKLTYHAGNYEDWEENTEEQKKRKMRLKELEDKRKKQILASIQKNTQRAKSTGDDKRLGMVASRKKALDRMGMQRLEDGKRYKESYHGYRAAITVDQGVKTAAISLPSPFPVPFHTNAILQLSEVSFKYKPSLPKIIDTVSLDVSPHARIALLGPNGCGKSTLMNLLAGELTPITGEVKRHHRLRIGYFSQHTVDQLNLSLSPTQQLAEAYPDVTISEGEARSHFAMTGITGSIVHQPIRTLSGGQRNRVALALVTFHQPHVLLLDEITNHLDMGTVESLVECLCAYEGALVVVSHDVWFLKEVIEGERDVDEDSEHGDEGAGGIFYLVTKKGNLQRWEKGLDAYVERVRKRAEKAAGVA